MSAGIDEVDRRTRGFRASLMRLRAAFIKEFIQLRRDRLTFGMIIGIPVLQLLLFGFAINADPKHLPTAILVADQGVFARTLVAGLQNSGYFDVARQLLHEDEAAEALVEGRVQFVVQIPQDFSRRLVRGERPALLVEADATDPAATSNALRLLRMAGIDVPDDSPPGN